MKITEKYVNYLKKTSLIGIFFIIISVEHSQKKILWKLEKSEKKIQLSLAFVLCSFIFLLVRAYSTLILMENK